MIDDDLPPEPVETPEPTSEAEDRAFVERLVQRLRGRMREDGILAGQLAWVLPLSFGRDGDGACAQDEVRTIRLTEDHLILGTVKWNSTTRIPWN